MEAFCAVWHTPAETIIHKQLRYFFSFHVHDFKMKHGNSLKFLSEQYIKNTCAHLPDLIIDLAFQRNVLFASLLEATKYLFWLHTCISLKVKVFRLSCTERTSKQMNYHFLQFE